MSPEKVAAEYGGDKRKIGQAVQMGILNPTVGVMAGMFIDRMRAAAAKEMQPSTTVAEEVLPQRPAGLEAARAAPPVERGLDALPVPDEAVPSFESGGIVAFAGPDGSLVEDIVEKETKEIEQGLRADYSPQAKQAMKEISQRISPANLGTLENQRYLQGEQQRMLAQSRDIASMYRKPGAAITPAARPSPVPAPSGLGAIAPPPPGTSVAEMMKSVPADVALRSAPGKTPEQSAADIVAARQARGENRPEERETVPKVERPSIAPASFEEALSKAKSSLGGLPKEDAFADIKAELAERKGKSTEDLKQAAYLRLAEAGFGMMAGTSPYAGVNIGRAAIQSIKGYGEDLKEQKKLDREDKKMLMDIKRLERAEARDDVFKSTELAYKIYNEANADVRARLASDTSLAAARISAAGRPTQYEQVSADLRSPDPTRRAAAEKYLGQAKMGTMTYEDAVKMAVTANPLLMMKGKEQELQNAVQNLLAGQGGASSRFKVLGREGT